MMNPFPIYAFHVLESRLTNVPVRLSLAEIQRELSYTTQDPPSPLFITWSKGKSMELRGCIGTFSPLELERGIRDYALISALEDHRFGAIQLKELPLLTVSVTLLQNFKDAEDAYDWTLGKHGIRISFKHGGISYGATFLPEVAIEQNWNKEETLRHLVYKAGYNFDSINVKDIKLVKYEGIKSVINYTDYKIFMNSL